MTQLPNKRRIGCCTVAKIMAVKVFVAFQIRKTRVIVRLMYINGRGVWRSSELLLKI